MTISFSRRRFLVGMAAAAAATALLPVPGRPAFDPAEKWRNGLRLMLHGDKQEDLFLFHKAYRAAKQLARQQFPPGTVFEVRYGLFDYDYMLGMAWGYDPNVTGPLFERPVFGDDRLLARLRA